jgi:murein DD-endopeptidase MepM/ murein hydrolase activator NlpD
MSLKENIQYQAPTNSFNQAVREAQTMARAIKSNRISNVPNNVPSGVSKYQPLVSSVREGSKIGPVGTVTTPYMGSTRYEAQHPGIDIANKTGTPIRAFSSGKVTSVSGGQSQGSPGYGNSIIVTDAQGNQHRYSHLAQEYVKVGQPVNRGSLLGQMGNSGQSYSVSGGTGTHLDYRVRDIYNKYVNPLRFIYS